MKPNGDNSEAAYRLWDAIVADAARLAIEYAEENKLSTRTDAELETMWQDAVGNRDLVAAKAVDSEIKRRKAQS